MQPRQAHPPKAFDLSDVRAPESPSDGVPIPIDFDCGRVGGRHLSTDVTIPHLTDGRA